jgi:hypothetical protein
MFLWPRYVRRVKNGHSLGGAPRAVDAFRHLAQRQPLRRGGEFGGEREERGGFLQAHGREARPGLNATGTLAQLGQNPGCGIGNQCVGQKSVLHFGDTIFGEVQTARIGLGVSQNTAAYVRSHADVGMTVFGSCEAGLI